MAASSLNFVTFNQDHTCMAVASSKGFRIYHTDPFSKIFNSDEGNISSVEMLFSTSLVAFVRTPRHLVVQNTKRGSIICELTFPTAVLAVRLNRKRMAVVLEEEIYLYDISNMTLLHTIATSPNPNAIFSLSPSSERCYMAYPMPKARDDSSDRRPAHAPPPPAYVPPTSGEVVIFDTDTGKAVNVIEAHRSPLSYVALNKDGTMVATASETGTIIRVFSVPGGRKLFQFRRGTIPSSISCMSFNMSGTLLCVSSATETVHIFRLAAAQDSTAAAGNHPELDGRPSALDPSTRSNRWSRSRSFDSAEDSPSSNAGSSPRGEEPPEPTPTSTRRLSGTLGGLLRRSSQIVGRSVAGAVGSYLPQSVTEMWEPQRDFANVKIPKQPSGAAGKLASAALGGGAGGAAGGGGAPLRSVVAMSNSSPHLMVAASDGNFYVFHIDLNVGGEGVLTHQYSLLDRNDKMEASGYGS
ncbi:hypothetical protein VTJ04DRAFT_8581 [Mycothermus thermophilus]|uniref:uncharacterized protein n=1 Tax=Humicola insolens TaxID=85995 RepID=UPI0037439648